MICLTHFTLKRLNRPPFYAQVALNPAAYRDKKQN